MLAKSIKYKPSGRCPYCCHLLDANGCPACWEYIIKSQEIDYNAGGYQIKNKSYYSRQERNNEN